MVRLYCSFTVLSYWVYNVKLCFTFQQNSSEDSPLSGVSVKTLIGPFCVISLLLHLAFEMIAFLTVHYIVLSWCNEYSEMPTLYLKSITEIYFNDHLSGYLLWACFSRGDRLVFPHVGMEKSTFLKLRVQEGEVYSHFIVLWTLLSV